MTELIEFTGPVLQPGDPGYDDEVAGFQAAYKHRPPLVVGAADAQDVQRAVAYAAERGLPVAVQATGHGLSVAATTGVLISTRRLQEVAIDPAARTARIGAGVRAGTLVDAAARHGLAPLNGSSPSVGLVGYTLGGGLGLLARQFGYAADHVRTAEVVTADGQLRLLSADDELFPALFGTGGNYGVVTALTVELVPIRSLYGGQLLFDASLMDKALEAWRELTLTAPAELTTAVGMLRFPDVEQLPPAMRGRYVASFKVAYTGPVPEGERLIEPLRAVGERLRDTVREMPYADSGSIYNDPDQPHPYAATNALVRDLPPEALAAMLEVAGPESPVPCVLDIRHLGGALGSPGPVPVAVDHRDAQFVVRVISMYGPGGADPSTVRERQGLLRQALAPWTLGHSLNFIYGDGEAASEAQTRAGYAPQTYTRLAALKARYDPHNMFRFNRNIRPAS